MTYRSLDEWAAVIRNDLSGLLNPGVVRMADALREVRDRRLYSEHYATFDDYCLGEWDMDPELVRLVLDVVADLTERPS